MKVSESMTRNPHMISSDHSLRDTAGLMAKLNVGLLLVGEGDRIVGIVTDRDIAIRGTATGKGPEAKVRDIMTKTIKYCYDDQSIDDVAINMSQLKVRRLPVVDRDKHLVGILSLSDIARADGDGHIVSTVLRDLATHPAS